MKNSNALRHFLAAVLAYCAFAIPGARADYTAVADNFSSNNFSLPVTPQFGFSVYQGQLYSWNTSTTNWGYGNYSIVDLTTNSLLYQSDDTRLNGNGYGDPLGFYDPVTSTFYAGTYNSSGSGLWRFNADGSWTQLGVFDSLYGVDSHEGRIYASGLNTIWNGTSGQDNQIALYDLSGNNQHDVLIQAIGNSANCAVDRYGNVYYANYGNLTGAPSGLYVWSAAAVASVRADLGHGGTGGGVDDIYLTYADGLFLTELPGGANGLTLDDAGNVFISVNGSSFSGIVMWNTLLGLGTGEDPDHYIEIASLGSDWGSWGWSGFLDAEGNVLDGGTLYAGSTMMGSDFSILTYDGDSVTPPSINDFLNVPEPGAWALIIIGTAALGFTRKLNQKRP